jgi:hypothetical protein
MVARLVRSARRRRPMEVAKLRGELPPPHDDEKRSLA